MYKLYDFLPSGNCYKIRLLLNQLDIAYERVNIDILNKQSRTPEFLKINPNGRTPSYFMMENTWRNRMLFYGIWLQIPISSPKVIINMPRFYSGCFLNSSVMSQI